MRVALSLEYDEADGGLFFGRELLQSFVKRPRLKCILARILQRFLCELRGLLPVNGLLNETAPSRHVVPPAKEVLCDSKEITDRDGFPFKIFMLQQS